MMRLFICCMLFLFFSIIVLISKDWDLPEEEKILNTIIYLIILFSIIFSIMILNMVV